MDRRTFLLGSAAATTAAALSTWFSADAEPPSGKPKPDPLDGKPGSKHLKAAYRIARDTGRPLLVLVEAPEAKRNTGRVLGPAINHASDGLLADLALCEIAYTTADDLAALVPAAAKLGTPMLFLVQAATAAPTVQAVEIELEDIPNWRRDSERYKSYAAAQAAAEKAMKAQHARIEGVLHATLAKSLPMLTQRAKKNFEAIGKDVWTRTNAALRAGQTVADESVLAAAALIRYEAETDPKVKSAFLGVLTAVRTRTLKKQPPFGAKWATTHGCGMTIEGVVRGSPGYACGMGHVAPLSSRFLIHYTKD